MNKNSQIYSHSKEFSLTCDEFVLPVSDEKFSTHSKELPLNCDEFILPISNVKLELSPTTELQVHDIHSGEMSLCQKQFGSETAFNSPLTLIGEKSFLCSICQLRFSDHYSLETHCLNEHICENSIECEACQKMVTVECILNGHHLSQKKNKPFLCDICQKGFSTKNYLNSHLFIHSNEKHVVCDVCQKRFKSKYCLKYHERIHTGEKPYVCNVCQQRFFFRTAFITHKSMHIDGKYFLCHVCNKGFTKRCDLKHHPCIPKVETP